MDPTLLRTREFTCMCPDCLEGQFEACELKEWVTEWDFRSLVLSPTGVQSVNEHPLIPETDEFHAGADHEVLSDTLAVGQFWTGKTLHTTSFLGRFRCLSSSDCRECGILLDLCDCLFMVSSSANDSYVACTFAAGTLFLLSFLLPCCRLQPSLLE
ncbi:hypothetical protein R1sor_010867 [Riccia sorocarpa]|uniref:Uncharacterized protein n=1 Tax=Riccia sorocarpa TaxID=122646 RepID=A0ABD3I3D5_9MARC